MPAWERPRWGSAGPAPRSWPPRNPRSTRGERLSGRRGEHAPVGDRLSLPRMSTYERAVRARRARRKRLERPAWGAASYDQNWRTPGRTCSGAAFRWPGHAIQEPSGPEGRGAPARPAQPRPGSLNRCAGSSRRARAHEHFGLPGPHGGREGQTCCTRTMERVVELTILYQPRHLVDGQRPCAGRQMDPPWCCSFNRRP